MCFTIAGYPKRGNPILGKVIGPYDKESTKALDQKPFTTLGYINGMGFKHPHPHTVEIDDYSYPRTVDQSDIDTEHPDYHQEAMVPLKSETHAGEDVPVYAGGPFAHLFHGVQEQSYIFLRDRTCAGLESVRLNLLLSTSGMDSVVSSFNV